MKKTVCILGSNPHSRDDAPWDDESLDIWALNEAVSKGWVQRANAVFQLHVEEIYSNPTNVSDEGHWEWLQEPHDFPIYMQHADERVPASVEYPLERIREDLPGVALMLDGSESEAHELTSTFPYAFALAIQQGYEKIKIIGVEMASGTEYQYQREGVKFWTAYALGRGIEVEYYSGHDMWPALLYAYDGRDITIPIEYFENRVEMFQPAWDNYERQHGFLKKKIITAVEANQPERALKLFTERRDLAVNQGETSGRLGVSKDYVKNLAEIAEVTDFAPFDRQVVEIRAAKSGMKGEEHRDMMNHSAGKCEIFFNIWRVQKNEEAAKAVYELMNECIDHCYKLGAMKGNMLENQEILVQLDEKIQAAGGAKSLAVLGQAVDHVA